MLEVIDELPDQVWGVRAKGMVSKEDYDSVLIPLLERARSQGGPVRFLYEFSPEFEGFTPGAAWEDLRVGLRNLRRLQCCAVVTDAGWLQQAVRVAATLLPCPMRVFSSAERQQAIDWLVTGPQTSLRHRIYADRGVLLVEPRAKLRVEDFDALAASVDTWTQTTGGALNGLVVHAHGFPGWGDFGAFISHVRFVREHHRKIRRIALAVDGKLADLGPALLEHFVDAELKHFGSDELDQALAWAGGSDAPVQHAP